MRNRIKVFENSDREKDERESCFSKFNRTEEKNAKN